MQDSMPTVQLIGDDVLLPADFADIKDQIKKVARLAHAAGAKNVSFFAKGDIRTIPVSAMLPIPPID